MRPRARMMWFILLFLPLALHAGEEEIPNLPPALAVHALTHARVVPRAGQVLEDATIVLRDGRIEAVGTDLEPPADARVWDLSGKTVYPGLIDPFTRLGFPEPGGERRGRRGGPPPREEPQASGPTDPNPMVHPEVRAADAAAIDDDGRASWRKAGFTAVVTAPPAGIFRGSAALVNLGDGAMGGNLVAEDLGQVVGFDHGNFRSRQYPGSMMGTMAVIRQTLLDADHDAAVRAAYQAQPDRVDRPEFNRALAALEPVAGGKMRVVFETGDLLGLVRAAGLLEEFSLDGILMGSGEEYRHLDWVRQANAPLILPVDFPATPEVGEEGPALDIPTATLRRWFLAPENPARVRQAGIPFALTSFGLDAPGEMRARVRTAIERGLSPDEALDAMTRVPALLYGLDGRLGTIEPGKIANLTVTDGDLFGEKSSVTAVWVDGRPYENKESGKADTDGEKKKDGGKGEDEGADDGKEKPPLPEIPWAPEPGAILEPGAVLVKNASVWTQGPEGILEGADLLVVDGRIQAVGRGLRAPRDAEVIDARGRHVTPGLIDAHSHAATAESVNEGTRAVTAEVRIADVLDPDATILYRLLAGGLTTANVLHGSANPIGGQNAVIHIRTGRTPQGLRFDGAPPGIKFALGENVKQANWGDDYTTRYPQTRMGVDVVIRQSFLAARDYTEAWQRWEAEGKAAGDPPPRRDLQLEAIAEVLSGKRLLHCHSYRQDEILALLLLTREFGIRVATFQHVLEGYKVGREMAAYGAAASTFSDWWAYKFEVYDAIPYNGALMHADGVLVSFNSDSDELARRLNLEAAKAVKYGGVPEEEALSFVTANPARQLGIDSRVGSLEAGKDGDFVIWSGDPLSTRSVVDQTWVQGVLYFDRDADAGRRKLLAAERESLIEAARSAPKEKPGKGKRRGARRPGEEVLR